jgi:hypothetical protein
MRLLYQKAEGAAEGKMVDGGRWTADRRPRTAGDRRQTTQDRPYPATQRFTNQSIHVKL